ncbi:hypothetical protein BHE74_00017166 [Ensete ventricosum]|nr:hypothetical protein BHE74_00017166 [Ensete ventricosum]
MEKPSFSLLAVDTKLHPKYCTSQFRTGPTNKSKVSGPPQLGVGVGATDTIRMDVALFPCSKHKGATTEHLTYDDSLQRGMQAEDEKGGARTPHLSIHVGIEYASTRR